MLMSANRGSPDGCSSRPPQPGSGSSCASTSLRMAAGRLGEVTGSDEAWKFTFTEWIGLDRWVLPKVGMPWQRDVAIRSPVDGQPAPWRRAADGTVRRSGGRDRSLLDPLGSSSPIISRAGPWETREGRHHAGDILEMRSPERGRYCASVKHAAPAYRLIERLEEIGRSDPR